MKKEYFSYSGKDRKGEVIAKPTATALWDFCLQEPEFMQAVEQSGKTFNDCIDSVVSEIGNACSDIEVYTKAVRFYFTGTTISVSMTINMSGTVEAEAEKISYSKPEVIEKPPVSTQVEEPKPKKITLDLDNLLDF